MFSKTFYTLSIGVLLEIIILLLYMRTSKVLLVEGRLLTRGLKRKLY